MSHRQRLSRSIYFRRLVSIRQALNPLPCGLRLWHLRILFQRAHAMALVRR